MDALLHANTQTRVNTKSTPTGYLFGPVIDFLGLGGASLIAMAILLLFDDIASTERDIAFIFMVVAHMINHPHFAHSYQIFYRNFGRKISPETSANLRWRYWFAGIFAPIGIAVFYVVAIAHGSVELIGLSVNLMFFLVGWHYVKQGFGMLSVDSVLKKKFFSAVEKRLLLWNSYAVWAYSYIFANIKTSERDYFGIGAHAINFDPTLYWVSLIIMCIFSIATSAMLLRRLLIPGKGIPLNGVVAYAVSLYIWLVAVKYVPLFLFVVPAFHSLQYLMVTTRFQLNVETEKADAGVRSFFSRFFDDAALAGLMQFYIVGAVLGYLAFWGLPGLVASFTTLKPDGFPYGWAYAVFWVFVNVHHYLLDNVMWRKGNPDVAKHLFAHR